MCPGRRDCDVKERERLRGRRAYVGMRGWPGGGARTGSKKWGKTEEESKRNGDREKGRGRAGVA